MKITTETISQINLFENLTHTTVRDCIERNSELYFLVEEGNVRKAVSKLKIVSKLFKKPVNVLGHSSDVTKFVRNLIYPNNAKIELIDKVVVITTEDSKTKGRIYGRDKENLKWILSVVKSHADIDDIKIL